MSKPNAILFLDRSGIVEYHIGRNIEVLRLHELADARCRVNLASGVGQECNQVVQEGDVAYLVTS